MGKGRLCPESVGGQVRGAYFTAAGALRVCGITGKGPLIQEVGEMAGSLFDCIGRAVLL